MEEDNKRTYSRKNRRFAILSVMGGILFSLACRLPFLPASSTDTPIAGYFVGTVWVYIFGIIPGLCSTMLGLVLFTALEWSFWPYFGWFIGNCIICIDVGIILLMLQSFIHSMSGEGLRKKVILITVFSMGIVLGTIYGIGLFKPITDWIIGPKPFVYYFQNGLKDSIRTIITLCTALPFAACIKSVIKFFAPSFFPDEDFFIY